MRPDVLGDGAGFVTPADAAAAGLSRFQLPNVGLRRLHRGLWVPAERAGDLATRCAAALRALPPGSAISHQSAAVLLGLPLPDEFMPRVAAEDADEGTESEDEDEPIHVSVPWPAHPRIRGLRVHVVSGPLPTMTMRNGLVLTGGARLWLDLATLLGRDDLVIAGDVIVRRRLATVKELRALVRAKAGARGSRGARVAVVLLDGRSKSPMETRLRLLLVDHGITGFLVNRTVCDEAGGWLCTPDIQFPLLLIALEYEGDQHRTDRRQWQEDVRRYEVMRQHGWVVIRLVAADVLDRPGATADHVRREIDIRHAALPAATRESTSVTYKGRRKTS